MTGTPAIWRRKKLLFLLTRLCVTVFVFDNFNFEFAFASLTHAHIRAKMYSIEADLSLCAMPSSQTHTQTHVRRTHVYVRRANAMERDATNIRTIERQRNVTQPHHPTKHPRNTQTTS